jgi:sugar lactone lactonase YvrE
LAQRLAVDAGAERRRAIEVHALTRDLALNPGGAPVRMLVADNQLGATALPRLAPSAEPPTATFVVTNANDSGPGSLRQAVQSANLNFQGGSRIAFDLPGAGVHTIVMPQADPLTPGGTLILTRPTEIDGFSQPGSRPNSLEEGLDAVPLIEFRGGLVAASPGIKIRGLIVNSSRGAGIELRSSDCVVEGCFIGTDATGTVGLGNSSAGVLVNGFQGALPNRVGGVTPAARNLISGNQQSGIRALSKVVPTIIQGNYIGTDASGRRAIGNNEAGVSVFGGDSANAAVMVGGTGPGEANSVAFNTVGIWVAQGSRHRVTGNRIFANREAGLDLGGVSRGLVFVPNGVSANDPMDADTGPNGMQNHPVITSVVAADATTTIAGSLHSRSNTAYRIEFFANSRPDLQCYGEGERFAGAHEVMTGADGNAAFSVELPGILTLVAATATDPEGNTSEFSATFVPPAGAFAPGDVFVSGSSRIVQWFAPDGRLKGCLNVGSLSWDTYGMAFGPEGTLYVTGLPDNAVTRFGSTGERLGTFAGGHSGLSWVIRFDRAGNAYIANGGGDHELRKFDPQGKLLQEFDLFPGSAVGLTSIALATDDRTLVYATEVGSLFGDDLYERRVGRFDVGTGQPLANLASNLPGLARGVEFTPDGRLLVAIEQLVVLLDPMGVIARGYDFPGEDFWNSVALGADGKTFWAGSDGGGFIYEFDLVSGIALRRVFVGEVYEGSLVVRAGAAPPAPAPAPGATFTVTNIQDTGPGSFRSALEAANATLVLDTIAFDIAGAGPHFIRPQSPLPEVIAPVVIDGYTQPGARPNPAADAASQTIQIALDGFQSGALTDGLVIAAGGSVVKGLSIVRFPGSGVVVANTGFVDIQGNLLGVDPAGAPTGNRRHGLLLTSAYATAVGGNGPASANWIGANFGAGIAIQGEDARGNHIAWNSIGAGRDGTAALGNAGAGVLIAAGENHVGADAAGRGGNRIAFNRGAGVEVYGPWDSRLPVSTVAGVAITGNSIHANGGLGIDLAPPGTNANDARGPDADDGPNNRLNFPLLEPVVPGSRRVGGTLSTQPGLACRVEIFASASCDPSGYGEGQEFVGGADATSDGRGRAAFSAALVRALAEGEFISAVLIASAQGTSEYSPCVRVSPGADLEVVIGASPNPAPAGTEVTFTIAVTNHGPGPASKLNLAIALSPRLALVSRSAGCSAGSSGVTTCAWESLAPGALVTATIVATPAFAGAFVVTAAAAAAEFEPAPGDNQTAYTMTATAQARTLVVSTISDSGPGSLRAALLEVNAAGTGADTIVFDLPGEGVQTIKPESDLPPIQGPVVIDGYSQPGARANTQATGTDARIRVAIEGSPPRERPGGGILIGTGVATGLELRAPGCVVRGLAIHSCGQSGVRIDNNHYTAGETPAVIEGCFLGTDALGLEPRGNLQSGIDLRRGAARIGGASAAARNLISGNGNRANRTGPGISADSPGPVVILGNLIGTDASGRQPLGNVGDGIELRSSTDGPGALTATIVGGRGAGEANVIAFNGGSGVRTFGNPTVVGNSIFANHDLGIGGTMPTLNDPEDDLEPADDIARQNHPTLSSLSHAGGNTIVAGSLASRPNETFTIDVYANLEPDESFFGEGQSYLGMVETTTDAAGLGAFTAQFPGQQAHLTATATDALGRTSEFSNVTPPPPEPFAIGDLAVNLQNGLVRIHRLDGTPVRLLDTGVHPDALSSGLVGAVFDPSGGLGALAQQPGRRSPRSLVRFPPEGGPGAVVFSDADGRSTGLAFDQGGNAYLTGAADSVDILKLDPLGVAVARIDVENETDATLGSRLGLQWLALAADQRTIYYTSRGKSVKRFDLATATQLGDFAGNLPGRWAFQFALFPDGGAIVADTEVVVRLTAQGDVARTYDVAGVDDWTSVAAAPDGATFWAAAGGLFGERFIYRFASESGALLGQVRVAHGVAIQSLATRGQVTSTPAPRLSVTLDPSGRVRLSWPASAAGFLLEVTEAVTAPIPWLPAQGQPTLDAGQFTLLVEPAATARFFRLRKP